MCLACQMDDELWFAYLDHVAQQEKQQPEKKAAADPVEPATTAAKPAPASPFVCEELPPE
jgi:hypothetical protein